MINRSEPVPSLKLWKLSPHLPLQLHGGYTHTNICIYMQDPGDLDFVGSIGYFLYYNLIHFCLNCEVPGWKYFKPLSDTEQFDLERQYIQAVSTLNSTQTCFSGSAPVTPGKVGTSFFGSSSFSSFLSWV